jgi:predicted ester cyclase
MVAEEDKVAIFLTMTGTNSGPFGNLPPSNKRVKFNGVDIVRIKDGKAFERWGISDDLSMMTQMGLIETDAIFQQR